MQRVLPNREHDAIAAFLAEEPNSFRSQNPPEGAIAISQTEPTTMRRTGAAARRHRSDLLVSPCHVRSELDRLKPRPRPRAHSAETRPPARARAACCRWLLLSISAATRTTNRLSPVTSLSPSFLLSNAEADRTRTRTRAVSQAEGRKGTPRHATSFQKSWRARQRSPKA